MSHSFHTDFTGVPAKELSLQDVLKEFHNGKMHAFSGACTFDKLDKVRNMQEQLAVEHFKLDKEKTGALYDDPNSLEKFKGLMNSMSALSEEIKKLHQEDGTATSASTAS